MPIQAQANTCPISLSLTYPDGEKGCLTDLPISKKTPKAWGKPIVEVASFARAYVVAASESCPDVSVAITNGASNQGFGNQVLAGNAIKSCPRECGCVVVVDNGRSILPKNLIMALGADARAPAEVQTASLKEPEKKPQEAKRPPQEPSPQTASLTDRELLLQLSAELARLRADAAARNSQPALAAAAPQPAVLEPLPVFANRKALVIGNDGYKFVSKLVNAKEDARVMADNLKTVGYNVTLKTDLSEKEMKAALRAFKSQVDAGDEVAFFYAGHGVQLGNSNYLVPIDVAGEGEEQMRDEGISLQRVLDDMSERRAKFTLAVVDACRDNPFKSNGRAIGGMARGLAPTTAATGQMVVFSAGTGQQALDKLGPNDKEKNGLFTRIFVREMQKPGISVDRVVRNVRGEVVNLAKSVGHDQVPAIYDQVVGEFYFRK